MFNVKDYLESDYRSEFYEERIGNETFLLRNLNGLERLKFQDLKTGSEAVLFVLARCVIDSNTKMPIGEENAEAFVTRYDALANAVATRIFKHCQDSLEAERQAQGLAEKNLPGTSGSDTTANIAEGTDSTP